MVEKAFGGFKVDWLTFTEFKDNLLFKFAENYHENVARFHVLMHRTHYFDSDVPQLDKKICFEIQPPMPGFTVRVFVDKGSILAQEMDRTMGWEVSNAFVIAELHWRKQDSYQWLELAAVPQYHWRNAPPPIAARAVPVEAPAAQIVR